LLTQILYSNVELFYNAKQIKKLTHKEDFNVPLSEGSHDGISAALRQIWVETVTLQPCLTPQRQRRRVGTPWNKTTRQHFLKKINTSGFSLCGKHVFAIPSQICPTAKLVRPARFSQRGGTNLAWPPYHIPRTRHITHFCKIPPLVQSVLVFVQYYSQSQQHRLIIFFHLANEASNCETTHSLLTWQSEAGGTNFVMLETGKF